MYNIDNTDINIIPNFFTWQSPDFYWYPWHFPDKCKITWNFQVFWTTKYKKRQ